MDLFNQITPYEMMVGIALVAVALGVYAWYVSDSDNDTEENAMDDEHCPPPGPWGGPL